MFTKEYAWYVRHLVEHVGLHPDEVMIVDSVCDWCRENGIDEADERKPLRLVKKNGAGSRLVIAELIPDEVLHERINALAVRSQLKSVREDRSDRLNSNTKKLAYLFLKEYAENVPALNGDDMAADEWVFEQMDRIGMLRI